jgi:AraC family transcriptional regulator of adaptative response / DNA-3-methyladenine glycosylase II
VDLDNDACYRAFRTRDARFDGRLYSGCSTTGVYCRPICPARTPRREHMSFFPTAAAAQAAGFRPCLRCRPEAAPDAAAWGGTSSTVSRALSLIESGALDTDDAEALASRLGIGERHLRRLFHEHLGASPNDVASTRRVLLATQLIRDTHLSMADVALAAGFGSIRRFNEVFRQLFGRPPRTLRGERDRTPAVPSQALTVRLPYRPPYDWPAMLAFLSARAITGIEVVSDDRYIRSIEISGRQGLIVVEPASFNSLQVSVRFPYLPALPAIIGRIRRMFDLGADPVAIDAHLATDPILAPLVVARPGLRVPGTWDAFELTVRAVLGQQITLRHAIGLAGRLVAGFGQPLAPHDQSERVTHVFPSASRIASANLAILGMPRARATALSALARLMADDADLLRRAGTLDECVSRLRSLPGVGEWTAHYIAMRELREPDAFPAADVALQRALQRLEGRALTGRELMMRAEAWRPWRAYAAQLLWSMNVTAGSSQRRLTCATA